MNRLRERLSKINRWLLPISLIVVMFLSLAHHTINYWELPAIKLLFLFLVFVPVGAVGIYLLGKKITPHLFQISRTQFILYGIGALLISSFITWRIYRAPVSYQSITITPHLSQNETVGLIELKADGGVIPLQQTAIQSKWQMKNGVYYATQNSSPLAISFKAMANAPLALLFESSPQSGSVNLALDHAIIEANLQNKVNSNYLVERRARYRGIPNSIFIPVLILLDIITFGVGILLLLILQYLGQAYIEQSSGVKPHFSGHRLDLGVLLAIGFILHLVNFLASPLLLSSDSGFFLQGASYLLKHGNLDGVSMVVGPGSTLLFAPILFLFGRNPAGIKILLHLLALACIPVSYWLGWKISRNRTVAILSGLIATLSPDLYFYSNYVMTDVPNILLVLVFCALLLSALESMQPRWIFVALLTSAFAILLRSENILLLLIGASVLAAEALRRRLQNRSLDWKKPFISLTLAFMIAVLPVLWWSAHNKRIYGFFGMSNYLGVVIYDGWIYYGDASHLAFSDQNSPAIQEIKQATEKYPIAITDKNGYATGWETYPALIKDGYTTDQAMNLLKTAALDSIQKNKDLALKLLFLKLQAGFQPEITFRTTYSLPGEPFFSSNNEFFDADNTSFPPLIKLQRDVNDFLSVWYPRLYPIWMLVSVLALTLSIFRQPALSWVTLIAIVATRIFIPLTLSVPFWRYTLAGWIPLQIITISWILIFVNGIQSIFGSNPLYLLRRGGQSSGKIASL